MTGLVRQREGAARRRGVHRRVEVQRDPRFQRDILRAEGRLHLDELRRYRLEVPEQRFRHLRAVERRHGGKAHLVHRPGLPAGHRFGAIGRRVDPEAAHLHRRIGAQVEQRTALGAARLLPRAVDGDDGVVEGEENRRISPHLAILLGGREVRYLQRRDRLEGKVHPLRQRHPVGGTDTIAEGDVVARRQRQPLGTEDHRPLIGPAYLPLQRRANLQRRLDAGLVHRAIEVQAKGGLLRRDLRPARRREIDDDRRQIDRGLRLWRRRWRRNGQRHLRTGHRHQHQQTDQRPERTSSHRAPPQVAGQAAGMIARSEGKGNPRRPPRRRRFILLWQCRRDVDFFSPCGTIGPAPFADGAQSRRRR